MKKLALFIVVLFMMLLSDSINAQKTKWVVGGRFGLAISSGGGFSSSGLQIGPMGELLIGKNMAIGSEFNINTQAGTPIEWADYFKYYFDVKRSKIKPYANAGFSLWFLTGGPYFGIRFGGGANFPITKDLYIPADLQLGPIFITNNTQFYIAITSGIRYYIN